MLYFLNNCSLSLPIITPFDAKGVLENKQETCSCSESAAAAEITRWIFSPVHFRLGFVATTSEGRLTDTNKTFKEGPV